jgi:hypothetical protein
MADIVSATKNFLSTLVGASEEQEKSDYVSGKPTPHRHHLIEEQELRARGWLQNCGAWERLHRSGGW